MGLGICIIGVAILFGILYHNEGSSERIYAYYCPPGFILFLIGHLLSNRK